MDEKQFAAVQAFYRETAMVLVLLSSGIGRGADARATFTNTVKARLKKRAKSPLLMEYIGIGGELIEKATRGFEAWRKGTAGINSPEEAVKAALGV